MRRNLLKQFMLTLSFFLLGGVGAWADIKTIGSKSTTWIFNSLDVENYEGKAFPSNTSGSNTDLNDEGLIYTGNTGSSLQTVSGTSVTINGSTLDKQVTQVIRLQESYATTWTSAFQSNTRTGETYNSTIARSFAINVSSAGTLYVVVKHTGNIDTGKQDRLYELLFNSSRQYSENNNYKYINTTSNINDNNNSLLEMSLHGDGEGVFWFRAGLQSDVYAIKFVPDVESPIIQSVENSNSVIITPGTCHIDGATLVTYYTAGGTLNNQSKGKIENSSALTLSLSASAIVKAYTIATKNEADTESASSTYEFTYQYATEISDTPTHGANDIIVKKKTLIKFDDITAPTFTSESSFEYDGLYIHGKSGITFSTIGGGEVSFSDGNDANFTATKYLKVSSGIDNMNFTNRTANTNNLAGASAMNADRAGTFYVRMKNTAFDSKLVGRYFYLFFNSALVDSKIVTANNQSQVLSYHADKAGTFYFSCGYAHEIHGVLFVPDESDITIENISNGNIAPKVSNVEVAKATKNSVVTLVISPEAGYQLKEGTLSATYDDLSGLNQNLSISEMTFTMPDFPVTVTAEFEKADLTLTDGSGEHGTLSFKKGEDPVTVAQVGDEVTIVVAPATGYKLQEGTLAANYNDGEAKVAAINDNKFTMPAYPINVAATFEAISYNINYDLAGGTVESANPTSYTVETESFTLNNPTKAGCTFAGWKLNGEGDPLTTVTIAQGTTGNLSYTATWTTDTYSITLPASENGNSVTANKTTGIESGETITLTITTGDDYVLTSIYADRVEFGVDGDDNSKRTFTMPDMNVEIKAVFTKKTAENSDKLATVDADIVSDGHATITNVEPESMTNTTTISISGEVNGTSVTAIADGAFESLSGSQVQSVDLSSTSVSLTGDRSSNAVLKDIPATALIYLPNSSSGVTGNNVVIKTGTDTYSCTNFVMEGSSNASYSVPQPFTAAATSLNRTFTDGQTCTLCLPYDVPAENIPGRIYTFTSITGNQVTMTEDTDGLNANVPYIFIPNGTDNISQSGGGITVQISNQNASHNDFTFTGIYEHHAFTTEEIAKGVYGFAGNAAVGTTPGHFAKATTGAYIEGMRAYLKYTGDSSDPGIEGPAGARGLGESEALPDVLYVTLINGDGSTTSIGKLELIEIDDNTPRYNLSGQRVGKDYKGIVIINGKKIYVK